jgi:hypothetical protein
MRSPASIRSSFADAYLAGAIDIDGDMLRPFHAAI